MKNHLTLVVACSFALAVVFTDAGFASDKFGNRGQVELGGTMGFTSSTRVSQGNTGTSTSTVALSPFVGYFIMNEFELGLHLQLNSTSGGGNTSSDYTVLLSPAWNIRLKNSEVTPVIAGLIGWGSVNNTAGNTYSGLSVGARAALKIQVVSNGNLHVGVEYLMNTRNPSGYSGSRNGDNVFNVDLGFTIFFP